MSNRPAIQKAVREELLYECRHRCACCCEPVALEKAHIVPWCDTQDHSAANLIVLCSNCHTRSHSEKWSSSTLRKYKKNPCALASNASPVMSNEQKAMVDLILAVNPEFMTDKERLRLASMVAAYVGVRFSEVRVVSVTETNSSRARLEMPSSAASKLIAGYQAHDPMMYAFLAEIGGEAGVLGVEAVSPEQSVRDRFEVKAFRDKFAKMWVATAVGGIAAISLTSWLGIITGVAGGEHPDTHWFILFRLSLPVVILLTYAWLGYDYAENNNESPKARAARIGQLADSLYFLGFLWTLWALIDAFVVHQLSITEAVFRTFGYALVTTATGMFLRLLLLQFQSSEMDFGVDQLQMEEQIALFTSRLSAASDKVDGFAAMSGRALDGWISSLNNSAAGLVSAVEEVGRQTGTLNEALVGVHRQSADQITTVVANAVHEFTGKLMPSLQSLSSTNELFVHSARSSADLREQLDRDAAKLCKSLENSAAKVETAVNVGVGELQAALQDNAGRLHADLSRTGKTISDTIEQSTKNIDDATAEFVTKLAAQTATLEATLASVARQFQQIRVPADLLEATAAQQTALLNAMLAANAQSFQRAIDELKAAVLLLAAREGRVRRDRQWWRFWT